MAYPEISLSLGQEDSIWLVDKITKSAKEVARGHHLRRGHFGESLHFGGFVFPAVSGAAWTDLELGSQLFYSPFTVWGFFVLFSSDSSCHNKLRVMLECKLLVQAEPFDFEPSGGLALRPIHANM